MRINNPVNCSAVPLTEEYRGELLDLTHYGHICVTDKNDDVILSVGDSNAVVFYRSAAKPLQAIPVLMRGLHKKYNLTDEETVIFSGSHVGDEEHLAVMESIFKKCGFNEQSLIVKPTIPVSRSANEARIKAGMPPRKFYHNCSGKHAALMILQRELTGSESGYELPQSPAEQEVMRVIAEIARYNKDDIKIGIDGCGVPVFALTLKHMAIAAKNFASPQYIGDSRIAEAVGQYLPMINRYKNMMRGKDFLCTEINTDTNIAAKGGANGVYALGLKQENIGIAFKLIDGTEGSWPIIIKQIFKHIGYNNESTMAIIDKINDGHIKNDNDDIVGNCVASF